MKVGVIGAGTMGTGIALSMAMSGFETILSDINEEKLKEAPHSMRDSLRRIYKKQNKTVEEVEAVINSVKFTVDIDSLQKCDFVFEAIIENMESKKNLFAKLDTICEDFTIFATNTSGLSVTEIASATTRPDRVIGTHFFNPVPVMELVEVIKGAHTSNETYEKAQALVSSINKVSIAVKDSPLFIVNRVLIPMLNEAMLLVEEGIGTAEDIDLGMQLGAKHPIGPLALADLIGLDTLLFVAQTLFVETGDSKYRVPVILKNHVRAGNLGRKSGKGFYDYMKEPSLSK